MNLDNELRGLLSERAGLAPEDAGLLDAVRVRSHQLTVRRRYGLAVLAGLVVLALLIPVGLLRREPRHTPLPPLRPTATASATPSATQAPDPGGVHVNFDTGGPALPSFPFALSWTPPGVHFVVGLGGGGPGGNAQWVIDDSRGLEVFVDTAEYIWDWSADTTTPTTVNGRAAQLRSGTHDGKVLVGLTWQLADGRWLTVSSWGGNTPVADVLRLARGVKAGVTSPAPLPFTLAAAPAGFVISELDKYGLCLAPVSWTRPGNTPIGLCVWLYPATSSPSAQPGAQPKTLGGHAGQWVHPSTFEFRARLADGRLLTVLTTTDKFGSQSDPGNAVWLDVSDADLDQFVAGITPTP